MTQYCYCPNWLTAVALVLGITHQRCGCQLCLQSVEWGKCYTCGDQGDHGMWWWSQGKSCTGRPSELLPCTSGCETCFLHWAPTFRRECDPPTCTSPQLYSYLGSSQDVYTSVADAWFLQLPLDGLGSPSHRAVCHCTARILLLLWWLSFSQTNMSLYCLDIVLL